MITYQKAEGYNLKVPVLHTVILSKEPDTETGFKMHYWCQQNCRAGFYGIPSWHNSPGYQFEDDEDAVLFALRWS